MFYVAPFVIALITFALGAFWYSPAGFLTRWAKESGVDLTQPRPRPKHPALVFGSAYVASVLGVFVLAEWIGYGSGLLYGVGHGLMVGGAIVAGSFAVNYAFGGKSLGLWLIDGGYHLLQFTLFGLCIGLWKM